MIDLTENSKLIHIDSAQSNSVVNNATKDPWSDEGSWKLCQDFGEEVRTHTVHVVVDLSEKDRSFIREDEDDVLDGVEGHSHGDEEESSISILNSLQGLIHVLEQDDCEDSCDDHHNQLDIGGLRKSDSVQEVSFK
jgi:hypothetical protein